MMKTLIFALLVIISLPLQAQTQVYKCERQGRTVFSDTPCANGAQPIQVRPAAGNAIAPSTEAEEQSAGNGDDVTAPVAQSSSETDRNPIADPGRQQQLDEQIARKTEELEKLETEAHTRLTQLEYQRSQPEQREKAEKLLSTLTGRYNDRLAKLRGEIEQLQAESRQLPVAPVPAVE